MNNVVLPTLLTVASDWSLTILFTIESDLLMLCNSLSSMCYFQFIYGTFYYSILATIMNNIWTAKHCSILLYCRLQILCRVREFINRNELSWLSLKWLWLHIFWSFIKIYAWSILFRFPYYLSISQTYEILFQLNFVIKTPVKYFLHKPWIITPQRVIVVTWDMVWRRFRAKRKTTMLLKFWSL